MPNLNNLVVRFSEINYVPSEGWPTVVDVNGDYEVRQQKKNKSIWLGETSPDQSGTVISVSYVEHDSNEREFSLSLKQAQHGSTTVWTVFVGRSAIMPVPNQFWQFGGFARTQL